MKTIQLPGYSSPTRINSIIWLKGEANYSRVYYQDGTNSIVTKPLSHFEQFSGLIRVHRSAIINLIHVLGFVNEKGRSGWVYMLNQSPIAVSRAYLSMMDNLFSTIVANKGSQ
jgi:DNA-binding LytR/AlgR family response regulator